MTGRGGILSIEKQEELAFIEGLPMSIRDIAETYDLRLVVRLVQEFGGVRVKVPWKFQEGCELDKRLGSEDAQKIIEHCCGDSIDVPRSLLPKEARAEIIYRMFENGDKQADMAREVGCTDRTVRRYLRKAGLNKPVDGPKESPQIDMFKE